MPYIKPSLLITTILGLAMAQPASALETADAGKFIADLSAAHAGFEVAVPVFTLNDTNSDGYPETIDVKYDVYSLGTTTKRYSSTTKTVNTPALGSCNPATAADKTDFTRTWVGRATTSKRITLVLEMTLDCGAEYNQRVVVYSADVSAGNKTGAWSYSTTGSKSLIAANGMDLDNDGINENLAMILSYDTAAGLNTNVVQLRFSNGTTVNSKGYPFIR